MRHKRVIYSDTSGRVSIRHRSLDSTGQFYYEVKWNGTDLTERMRISANRDWSFQLIVTDFWLISEITDHDGESRGRDQPKSEITPKKLDFFHFFRH